MIRLLFMLPLLLFVALAAWMAVPLLTGQDPNVIPSALIDQPTPETNLPPLPGREAGLGNADWAGEVALVNVFASWCVPCLAEHPILTRLALEEGVPLYGINYKDAGADAVAWLARHGDPYTAIGTDFEGSAGIDWGITGVPETFLVDRAGRIRYRHAGPITPVEVNGTLMPLIERLRGGE